MIRIVFTLAMIVASLAAYAIDTGKAFDDPALQTRYDHIVAEVRCLKCQNQTIKDSNALLAVDLRREIRRLLTEGKSDAEVFDFLVTRYGEFALYRPRMGGKTLFLWIAPLFFLAVGAFIVMTVIRGRMSLPIDDDPDDLVG